MLDLLSRRNGALLALLVVIGFGAALRLQGFTGPWTGLHNAWGGATYGNIGRNLATYGLLETRLGPVVNFGPASPPDFVYYYHYPPLLVWLVWLSFRVFGVAEWSARLVPLVFSLLEIAVVFGLARRLYSSAVALIAALFMAVLPIGAYYGAHVDVYGPTAVFFPLLAFYGYALWLERRDARSLALLTGAVVLGALTSWFAYFVPPLILVHWWRFAKGERRRPPFGLLAALATPLAVFALFLAHRQLLISGEGSELLGTLMGKLQIRTSYSLPFWKIWAGHGLFFVRLYSPLIAVLAAVWCLRAAVNGLKGRLGNGEGLVLALLGFGVAHNLAFPSLLHGHDYMVGCYAPAIAIAAAAVFCDAAARLAARLAPLPAAALVAAGLVVAVGGGLYWTLKLWREDDQAGAERIRRRGVALRGAAAPADEVLVATRPDHVLQYYAQRDMGFDVAPSGVLAGLGARRGRALYVCAPNWAEKNPEALRLLDARFPRRRLEDLIVYEVPAPSVPPGE